MRSCVYETQEMTLHYSFIALKCEIKLNNILQVKICTDAITVIINMSKLVRLVKKLKCSLNVTLSESNSFRVSVIAGTLAWLRLFVSASPKGRTVWDLW